MTLLLAAIAIVPTPSANDIIASALLRSRQERKPVLLYFRASWCSWCRRTEAMLSDPDLGEAFADSYVIAKITIREKPEKRQDENEGWEDVLRKYRGNPARDVPYFAVVNGAGKKIGEPYRPTGAVPDNGGFPRTDTEIGAWVQMVRSTAPSFSNANLQRLRAFFTNG